MIHEIDKLWIETAPNSMGYWNNGALEYWARMRIVNHIIPPFHYSIHPAFLFPMILYAGLFSNRWKQRYLSQARTALNQTDNDDTHTYTLPSWVERQAEYTGINPLICPNCEQPLTYIGTFFGNWNGIQYLFDTARKDFAIPSA